jgi:hypothetical protein
MFTRNESRVDRIIRAIVGVVLLVLALAVWGLDSTAGIIALVLAVIMLVTAATGFCPLYRLFGIATNRK